MTLEEAIENERELAEGCRKTARDMENDLDLAVTAPYRDILIHDFKENAEKHEQLATWLEELKEYRENEFSDEAYQHGRIDAAEFILKMAHTDNIPMCSELVKELSQVKNCCSKWLSVHDAEERIKFAKWLTINHPVYDEWGNAIPAYALIDKFNSQ